MSAPAIRLYKDESLTPMQVEKLTEIWNLFREDNFKYLLRHEALSIKSVENTIFVFAVFEGQAFSHLRSLKAR
jgi:hypothetical protein